MILPIVHQVQQANNIYQNLVLYYSEKWISERVTIQVKTVLVILSLLLKVSDVHSWNCWCIQMIWKSITLSIIPNFIIPFAVKTFFNKLAKFRINFDLRIPYFVVALGLIKSLKKCHLNAIKDLTRVIWMQLLMGVIKSISFATRSKTVGLTQHIGTIYLLFRVEQYEMKVWVQY